MGKGVSEVYGCIPCNSSLMPNSECSLIFASTTVWETYIMEILQKVGTILKKD
jgi:hypothetical protein